MNTFISSACAKWLQLEQTETVEPVNVLFVQGSNLATHAVKDLEFNVEMGDNVKSLKVFEEVFTVGALKGLDLTLENIFIDYYEIQIRRRSNPHIAMVNEKGKTETFKFTKKPVLDGLGIHVIRNVKQKLEEQFLITIMDVEFLRNKSKGTSKHEASLKSKIV